MQSGYNAPPAKWERGFLRRAPSPYVQYGSIARHKNPSPPLRGRSKSPERAGAVRCKARERRILGIWGASATQQRTVPVLYGPHGILITSPNPAAKKFISHSLKCEQRLLLSICRCQTQCLPDPPRFLRSSKNPSHHTLSWRFPPYLWPA